MKSKRVVMSVVSAVFNISVLIIVIVLIKDAAAYVYDYGYRIFAEPPMAEEPGRDVIFTVEPGDSVEEIAANLKKEGLIRDASLFVWQERVSAYYGDEKAGTYTLNTSQTVGEMLAILAGEASSTVDE